MPSSRGAHPEDPSLFAPSKRPTLRAAVRDLSWLRTQGYGDHAAQTLVGDHYRLTRRQRNAVGRSACGDAEAAHRRVRRRRLSALAGEWLEIDGFNPRDPEAESAVQSPKFGPDIRFSYPVFFTNPARSPWPPSRRTCWCPAPTLRATSRRTRPSSRMT